MAEPDLRSPGSRRVARLIALGRDREAAELAIGQAARTPHPTGGAPMDVLTQLDELGPLLAGVVGGIDRTDLDNATPCADFTVAGVLGHMVAGATQFAASFRGEEAPEPDLSDPLATFPAALGGLAAAIAAPGALERQVPAPFGGDLPGEVFARFVVLDGLIHGWDMATATGQAYAPSDDLVAAVQAFAEQALPPLHGSPAFGTPVEAPDGAAPIERLAAFSGRTVAARRASPAT